MHSGFGHRRLGLRLGVLATGMAVGFAGCGDPLLPADYAGPPAAAVAGNVFAWEPSDKLADHPMLSLEWLGALDTPSLTPTELFGQPLRFVRSPRLENDWEIDLPLPMARAKLSRAVPEGRIELSVGKVVYFDDRTQDGQLDWACIGQCDVIKAVSPEFVVFIEQSPPCRKRAASSRGFLDRGFHYFRMEGGRPRELRQDEPMSFVITHQTPSESNPQAELRAFAEALFQLWSLNSLGGC